VLFLILLTLLDACQETQISSLSKPKPNYPPVCDLPKDAPLMLLRA
jgi:hypothetical protein